MLARTPIEDTRLSADQLGITQEEYDALIDVRNDLASGRVKHVRDTMWEPFIHLDPKASLFNMKDFTSVSDCGAVQCIGGFMMARLGGRRYRPVWSDSLKPLFMPRDPFGIVTSYVDLTVEQAVSALDHFFQGAGDECWDRAVADVPFPS